MEKPLWERDSFFKVMIGDFQTILVSFDLFKPFISTELLCSLNLLPLSLSLWISQRIPPCFHKHLLGEVMVKLVLRSRGGRKWAVILKREGESLFFGNGWERFVADLAIQLGEFLLFVYDGNLGFDVKIYGITGCEKEVSNASVKEEQEMEESQVKVEAPAKTSSWPRRAATPAREVFNGRVILKGLTKFGNERALKSARSFKSSKPFFISTYRSSRKSYMTIPVSIMRECELGKINMIVLQDQEGRSWPVRIAHWIGRPAMANGWTKFAEVNCLEEGDVCVFEFFEGNKTTHVHIFRADVSSTTVLERAGNKKCEAEVLRVERPFITDARFASMFSKSQKYELEIPQHVLKEKDAVGSSKTTLRDPCGRSWQVGIRQRVGGRTFLGRGWCHFCIANQLQEGDICNFELVCGIRAMNVQIRRPEL